MKVGPSHQCWINLSSKKIFAALFLAAAHVLCIKPQIPRSSIESRSCCQNYSSKTYHRIYHCHPVVVWQSHHVSTFQWRVSVGLQWRTVPCSWCQSCALRLGGVGIKSPPNAKTRVGIKMQICERYLIWFSLYLDQKAINLKALNKSAPLIRQTHN